MKIIWNINPLKTTFELTDEEKEIFRQKVINEQLKERMDYASYLLNEKYHETFKLDKIRELLNVWTDDGEDYLEFDEYYEEYLHELENGFHVGDCTCVACSCSKCMAESILGVNTIAGLGKHSAYKVGNAVDHCGNLDDALDYLKNYKVKSLTDPEEIKRWASVGGYEQHIPRWEKEAQQAYKWLLKYKEEHFS